MKIGQYCQRQLCKHVELEQFLEGAFASCGFVSDSWAFLFEVAVMFKCDKLHLCICDKTLLLTSLL